MTQGARNLLWVGLLTCILSAARVVEAQPLGTFTWQLQPLCNVVTVNIVQTGAVYTLDGWDDQCGAAVRAPLVGTATLNPEGTVGLGLHIVTTPGGAPLHVDATLTLPSTSGTWRDSAGNGGTFALGANTGGNPRELPGTHTHLAGGLTNVAVGPGALASGNGGFNTAVGSNALNVNAGNGNTATGRDALTANGIGSSNSAFGNRALAANTTGFVNSAFGDATLDANTTGAANSGFGAGALGDNTTGSGNVAFGTGALGGNTTGSQNAAFGTTALSASTSGIHNVAVGDSTLRNAVTASANTAVGQSALNLATEGSNTAVGGFALDQLTTGTHNVALGYTAGVSLVSGSNNLYLSAVGGGNENATTRIGNAQTRTFISGIRGVTTGQNNAVAVIIDSNGQLGTVSSSRRTKDSIETLDAEVGLKLQALRPVQFRYRTSFSDGAQPLQYGLIAEEVETVLPDLVAYGTDGGAETVKYHVLPALLLAEVQRLERERAAMVRELAELRAMVEALSRR